MDAHYYLMLFHVRYCVGTKNTYILYSIRQHSSKYLFLSKIDYLFNILTTKIKLY